MTNKNEDLEMVELKVLKKDLHYLYKILHQGFVKAQQNYDKTLDQKPLNDIWKDTIEVNRRLRHEITRFDLL